MSRDGAVQFSVNIQIRTKASSSGAAPSSLQILMTFFNAQIKMGSQTFTTPLSEQHLSLSLIGTSKHVDNSASVHSQRNAFRIFFPVNCSGTRSSFRHAAIISLVHPEPALEGNTHAILQY